MPKPIPVSLRQSIVERHQRGERLTQIAQEVGRPYESVRNVWRIYRHQGRLEPDYGACGQAGPRCSPKVYRAALWLKRRHPGWGAPLIRTLIAEKWTSEVVPHERTLQRWFRQAGLQARRQRRPPSSIARGHRPHAVWEVDSKEQITLATGEQVSWLVISDEYSGAVLHGTVFPYQASVSVDCRTGAAVAADEL